MRIVSYDGYVFEDHDYWARISWSGKWGQWSLMPSLQTRLNAPALLTGAVISQRVIPVLMGYEGTTPFDQALRDLLAHLDPIDATPRTLLAELPDGTPVSCEAIVTLPGGNDGDASANVLLVTFETTDPFWNETTASTQTETTIDAGDLSRTVTNNGATSVYPTIRRYNNTGFVTALTYRRPVSITNNGDLPLERETVMVPTGDVFSDFQYNRMLKDGTYYPTTLMRPSVSGWDQYNAFPVTVDAGETETFDLLRNPGLDDYDLDTYTRFDGNYSALDLGWREVINLTGATGTTLTDSGEAWTVNRWAGASVVITGGTGMGQARQIVSNTATTLTVARAFTTTPSTDSDIAIYGSGWYFSGGKASSATSLSITDSAQSWPVDALIGGEVVLIGGTGSGQRRTITDNTATNLVVGTAFSPVPDTTTVFRIERAGYHRYYVDQVKHSESHRGLWQQNKRFTRPSKILWGDDILNGWAPFLLTDNNDDFNQSRTCPVDLGGSDVDYFPILDADRRRGQDRRLQEEGQADGVSIYHPWGYSAMVFDYQLKNPNGASGATKGITKFIVAGREAGGDEFETFFEDDTLRTSLTASSVQTLNLTSYGSPEQLYMGLQPQDEVEVSRDALESDTATVRNYTVLRLFVDIADKFSYSVGAQESVIPVEDEIRIGDYALQIGMRDGQRLYMNDAYELWFDCANARAWIEDGAGNEVEDVTYAVTPVVYDGTSYRIADRWPPLAPGANTVTFSGSPWDTTGGFDIDVTWREAVYG